MEHEEAVCSKCLESFRRGVQLVLREIDNLIDRLDRIEQIAMQGR